MTYGILHEKADNEVFLIQVLIGMCLLYWFHLGIQYYFKNLEVVFSIF